MKPAPLLFAFSLALAGCAALPYRTAEPDDGLARAALGQTIAVGGPRVTPLAVHEDSRCPAKVQCVWAGRVRIGARIDLGSGSRVQELILGTPAPVADGTLELVEVRPGKMATDAPPILPRDYRFAFRFMGGL